MLTKEDINVINLNLCKSDTQYDANVALDIIVELSSTALSLYDEVDRLKEELKDSRFIVSLGKIGGRKTIEKLYSENKKLIAENKELKANNEFIKDSLSEYKEKFIQGKW